MGRTIRVSGKNLTEVMLEFEFKIKCMDNPYLEGARITLDEWFDTWFKTYKEPNICQNSIYPMRNKYNSTFGKKDWKHVFGRHQKHSHSENFERVK